MYHGDRTTTWAIILAGGRATRLGPLTAQMNKALVSVGQRPIISYQLEAFRSRGIRNVIIVTSPDSTTQVRDVIERSHGGLGMNIRFVEQYEALGPGNALQRAMTDPQLLETRGGVVVAMADTFFEAEHLDVDTPNWVGVSDAPSLRHWCYYDSQNSYWREGETHEDHVAIGLYHFDDLVQLKRVTSYTLQAAGEIPMAPILNGYGELALRYIPSWLDVGDVKALASARRKRFLSRSFNNLRLDDLGRLTKVGTNQDFTDEITMLGCGEPSLWPTVYESGPNHVVMEYLDMPSLAELYLYWPGRPDMWAYIIEDLVERLRENLWCCPPEIMTDIERRCVMMYITKMIKRFMAWDHPIKKHECLTVNGQTLLAGRKLLDKLSVYIEETVIPTWKSGTIHGDLNMSNVLYSLGTGTFKLIDPRGRWGGVGPYGDVRYELAKLRYSYADHFCSITHGLVDWTAHEEEVSIYFGPDRTHEALTIDRVLCDEWDLEDVKVIEASIFLSSMPLHAECEAVPLYVQGVRLANEVLT